MIDKNRKTFERPSPFYDEEKTVHELFEHVQFNIKMECTVNCSHVFVDNRGQEKACHRCQDEVAQEDRRLCKQ